MTISVISCCAALDIAYTVTELMWLHTYHTVAAVTCHIMHFSCLYMIFRRVISPNYQLDMSDYQQRDIIKSSFIIGIKFKQCHIICCCAYTWLYKQEGLVFTFN